MALSFRRLLLWINSILIVASLLISLIFAFALLSPTGLENFDKLVRLSYASKGSSRARRALEDLREGETRKAFRLLDRWEEYKEGDRFFTNKREVAIALAKLLEENGSYQESVDVIEPFVEEDDRDLVSFMVWASSALEIKELRESAAKQVNDYWTLFSASRSLADLYFRKVYAWDDPAAAREIVEKYGYLDPVEGHGWEVYWAGKQEFTAEKRIQVKFKRVGNGLKAVIELPKDTQKLRLDVPAGQSFLIRDLEIYLGGEEPISIAHEDMRLNMIEVENGVFRSNGSGDPFFVIDLEDLDGGRLETLELVVSMKLTDIFSAWLEKRMEEL